MRLVGGTSSIEGRVEIFYNGTWGTICDDGWNLNDATVACLSLGFPGAIEAVPSAAFGQGAGPILISNVSCHGNESNITDCSYADIDVHDCDHTQDVGVRCEMPAIRLDGVNSSSEGRLEIFYNGQWGTVCDNTWDFKDATVVCKSLGFQFAVEAVSSAAFGEGAGPILIDNVDCYGQESNILECSNSGFGIHNCNHREDAGVRCGIMSDWSIRLTGGTSSSEGRVEIFYNGSWGTVCADYWGLNDADVVCKSLGFQFAVEAVSSAGFGRGTGPILMDDVGCYGQESNLFECWHRGFGIHNCDHSEDAGVRCRSDWDIRLVGGTSSIEGRVEIFYNGTWGTICDDGWNLNDATVVCLSLGFPGAIEAVLSAEFGEGAGPILISNVSCRGNESTFTDCSYSDIGVHDCDHTQDAGVQCEMPAIRLDGGNSSSEGRVEIFYNGQWGTVCDNGWDLDDATVVCKSLGFHFAVAAVSSSAFRQGTGPILIDNVGCDGQESNLFECRHSGFGIHYCSHSEDAGVRCGILSDWDMRLAGGTSLEGRVEIFYNGTWGTICDDGWNLNDATVVCLSLGFPRAIEVVLSAEFGEGAGPILISNVSCHGNESNITDCSYSGIGVHDCGHTQDAGVRCEMPAIRLGGVNSSEGRLEIFYNGQWGTVCDNGWDLNDATVVCKSLDFQFAVEAVSSAAFGEGTGPILIDNVGCDGHESSILECSHNGFGIHNCNHREDAGIRCGILSDWGIRLSGGASSSDGRVEIFYNGQWGTVCDYSWDLNDATVVCKSLGFQFAIKAVSSAGFGQGTGPVLMHDVRCDGQESNLFECWHRGFGNHYCGHSNDVGVRCRSDWSIRLTGGRSSYEGRVEISYNGQWGTVCDDSWDLNDANVVCKSLGFPFAIQAFSSAGFGKGTGPILMDDVGCDGQESNLFECWHRGFGIHNCDHSDDAGVRCRSDHITLSPVVGTMFGGTQVVIEGPGLNDTTGIICDFDGHYVKGRSLSPFSLLCVTPPIFKMGQVPLFISLNGGGTFDILVVFTVQTPEDAPIKVHSAASHATSRISQLSVTWDVDTLDYVDTVDVVVYGYEEVNEQIHFKPVVTIAEDVDYDHGHYFCPSLPAVLLQSDVGVIGVIESHNQTQNYTPAAQWGVVHVLQWLHGHDPHQWCSDWIEEDEGYGLEFLEVTPPCPCTLSQTFLDLARFTPHPDCNIDQTSMTRCQNKPGADHCVRSNIPSVFGSAQECCYDSDGVILNIALSDGGGYSYRYHHNGVPPYGSPGKVPYMSHFLADTLPWIYCCRYTDQNAIQNTLCDTYKQLRPSQVCDNYSPPTPAIANGDPHIATLDSTMYTFNGHGEFTLLSTLDNEFVLQARTAPLTGVDATIFVAIAAKFGDSDVIHVQTNDRRVMNAYRRPADGSDFTFVDFDQAFRWTFKGVSLNGRNISSTRILVVFDGGVGMELKASEGAMSILLVAPDSFRGRTQGLMGMWNGDPSDDFLTPDNITLPANLSTEELHYQFGLQWEIEANESLLYYEVGMDHEAHTDRAYVPIFEPVRNRGLNQNLVIEVCGTNLFCIFDFQTTGLESFAQTTVKRFNQYEAALASSEIVSCPHLVAPGNGSVTVSRYSDGGVATFACANGFKISHEVNLACQPDGQWSDGETPHCLPTSGLQIWVIVICATIAIFTLLVAVGVVAYCAANKRPPKNQVGPRPFEAERASIGMEMRTRHR